jgi:D-3-phosphoglycerate dehydrogenase
MDHGHETGVRVCEMPGVIAVTPRSLSVRGHPALSALSEAGFEVSFPTPGKQPTAEEQLSFLPECVGYLAGAEPISRTLLERCPNLRVISRNGVGVDAVDIAAAAEFGIAVETTPGANSQGVAELAIALMLSGLRHIPWSDRQVKAGVWQRREGIEVNGRTLGVIGCGQIGQRVARMALGLGMAVRAFDEYPDPGFAPAGDFGFAQLGEVLRASDVVTLHCPPGHRPLIGTEALAKLRRGAYVVNTARASLVDHGAVLLALDEGRLSGFATDVYDVEPPTVDELLVRDNVLATPHAGGLTAESVERATRAAVENLLRVLAVAT